MNVGERIRVARKKAGLTQAELAEKAKLSINTIRLYEAGKRYPTTQRLAQLVNALGTTFDEVLGDSKFDGQLFAEESVDTMRQLLAKLNYDGQKVAIERVEELTEIPKYQRKSTE